MGESEIPRKNPLKTERPFGIKAMTFLLRLLNHMDMECLLKGILKFKYECSVLERMEIKLQADGEGKIYSRNKEVENQLKDRS